MGEIDAKLCSAVSQFVEQQTTNVKCLLNKDQIQSWMVSWPSWAVSLLPGMIDRRHLITSLLSSPHLPLAQCDHRQDQDKQNYCN